MQICQSNVKGVVVMWLPEVPSVFELGLPSGFDVAGVPYVGFGSGVEQSYFDHSFQYILSAEFFLVRNRNSFCLFESEESAFTC